MVVTVAPEVVVDAHMVVTFEDVGWAIFSIKLGGARRLITGIITIPVPITSELAGYAVARFTFEETWCAIDGSAAPLIRPISAVIILVTPPSSWDAFQVIASELALCAWSGGAATFVGTIPTIVESVTPPS